ncbi:uncharacterized protein LOC109857421 [Pseudomyrmex gracilis]|uniref:uncharacterized protein LOC109857421 n=1 Tax=Pseudomyrmex gracilis TaxID=219809 RepID=UPI0009957D60|nr:uncharacterized protein LOC109857421 [Pseudomyrmex gracilis]
MSEANPGPESDSTIEDYEDEMDDTSIKEDYAEIAIAARNKKKYARALELSFLFFEAQRSGKLPKDNRIPWRGDSAMNDRGHDGEDLTGGYYNFGRNYIKYTLPTAFTTTMLAWSVLTWPEGYKEAGQLDEAYKAIKWATDYFLKCHKKKYEFYIKVGSETIENNYWGRPEDMNHTRQAYKADSQHPASDVLAETVAALASASIVFKDIFSEISYSKKCLNHAKNLYKFANKYNGSHFAWMSDRFENLTYDNDMAWATIWLYKASKDIMYFGKAMNYYVKLDLSVLNSTFSYKNKLPGIQIVVAQMIKQLAAPSYRFCDTMTNYRRRTRRGLVYLSEEDALPLAANVAFLCLVAATSATDDLNKRYYIFAKQQINYMLGMGSGRSYVVGYDATSPKQPRHLASSCPSKPVPCEQEMIQQNVINPQTLYGALVSGPNVEDDLTDYRNIRADESRYICHTNVKIENNAGFTGVLAGLLQLENRKKKSRK